MADTGEHEMAVITGTSGSETYTGTAGVDDTAVIATMLDRARFDFNSSTAT